MNKRILSIDRFRGFIVFCMCFFVTAGDFPCLGIFSRVANNSASGKIMLFNNMSLADLLSPLFIFLISLSYLLSFNKRYKKDGNKAYIHFITRYLCFMGLGSIMVSFEYLIANNGKDPFLFMSFLMFISIFLLILYILLSLFKNVSIKLKNAFRNGFIISLVLLGIISLIFGIRDDILLFLGSTNLYKHWSILTVIGCTGLLNLLFVKLNLKKKIIAFILLLSSLTIFQMLPNVINLLDVIVLGGFLGSFSYLVVMLGGTIMIDIYLNHKRYYLDICIVLLGIISILFVILPTNTSACTINYMCFALFVGLIIFYILNIFNDKEFKYDFFIWWGRNPLILYGLYLPIRLFEKVWNPSVNTNIFIAIIFTFGINILLTFFAYKLYKKDIIIKL